MVGLLNADMSFELQIALQKSIVNHKKIRLNHLTIPTHMICKFCGSTDVCSDAHARWNTVSCEWELSSVYDAKECLNCECETNLLEVTETDIEICIFGMIADGDGFRLVKDHETPIHFDVLVKTTHSESGEILALHEFDELSKAQAEQEFTNMQIEYPTASTESIIGKIPKLSFEAAMFPKGK